MVAVHKKGDKQVPINYRLVSLLRICRKIFERLLYNYLFEFLIKNDLIVSNRSDSKQDDLYIYIYIYQLLPITHEIYGSIDNGFEVRGIFVDITKAFDKVWQKCLIFKFKKIG